MFLPQFFLTLVDLFEIFLDQLEVGIAARI